jgi:hypothetical protein
MEALRSFGRGVFEAVWIVALFVGGGLGFAEWLDGGAQYLPVVEEIEAAPDVWLVDGYNAIAVGLMAGRPRERWWGTRFRSELLDRVAEFEEREAEVWVVFDGPQADAQQAAQPARSEAKPSKDRTGVPEGERTSDGSSTEPGRRIRSVFAPSADDWLLARIRESDPQRTTLVTADRQLADRARHRGVAVVAPAEFLARCRALG